VYLAESASTPPDIWIAKPGFQDRRRLTRINPQLDRYVFGESRLVRWLGTDGQPLSGALYLPAGYQAGKQYPLIVGVYGGSTPSTRVHRFGSLGASLENQQLYATRGYAMLLPDMPLRLGTPMQDIAGTVLPGINRVIELGIADPARVGVIGGSYGGYSALALLVQSHRFAAAVAVASPANLFSYYAQLPREGEPNVSWLETGQGRMGGDPWELRSRYVENSPFFYLDRIKTPVLLVHGTADVAVPVMESDAVYVALWRLGKEVEYARYVGEGHGGWSRINSLDYVQRTLAWFERYLKPIAAQSGGNETAGRTARGR
jgi:dipeptidyl aminopeptidase/acylaminoacyl peptidase